MIKNLKLKILICFNPSTTEHWTPLCQTHQIYPIPLLKFRHFFDIGSDRWRATNVLWALELEERHCEDLTSFEFLSVHSLTYLSSSSSFSTVQGNMGSFHSFYNDFHGNSLQRSHNWKCEQQVKDWMNWKLFTIYHHEIQIAFWFKSDVPLSFS
jgi:hypothetical protein